jgi:hypothetical protein
MAAWDVPRETVSLIVAGAKRSEVYREVRAQLAGPCPLDVWVEGDHGFVQFELDEDHREDGRPGWLLFGVRLADGGLVAAKVLDPGPGEMELTVSDLLA